MFFEDWELEPEVGIPSLPELDDDIYPLLAVARKVADRRLHEDMFPNMDWMITSLQNLVLIKLGPSDEFGRVQIGSRLLVYLLDWLLSKDRLPKSLLSLWISDFYFPGDLLFNEVLSIASPLKAFLAQDLFILEEEMYDQFHNLEQFSGIRFSSTLAHLPNLKAVSGINDELSEDKYVRNLAMIYKNDV